MKRPERFREPPKLRGNVPVLFLTEMISNTGWNMEMVVWQPYNLSLGASVSNLGSLTGAQTLLRSVLLLFSGRVSDCVGRKRLMMTAFLFSIPGIMLSILAGSWILLVPTFLLWGVSGALWEPSFRSITAESVSEKNRGTAFSIMGLTWFLPGFYAPALAGFIAELYGFRSVLAILLVAEASSCIIFSLYVKETLKERRTLGLGCLSSVREVLRPKSGLSGFYAAVIVQRSALALIEGIFYGMLFKSFGFTLIQLGILSSVFCVVTSAFQIPMGRLVDRGGRKRFLMTSGFIKALAFGGYILSESFWGFLLFHVLSGLADSIWIPAYHSYLSNAVRSGEMGRFFGDIAGLMGIISFPAPILGSLLYDGYGFKAPLTASLILLSATVLALKGIEEG